MAIRIITDSTASIPREFVKEHNLIIVPLKITLDDEESYDYWEDEYHVFYDKLAQSKGFPTTSLPSPEEFDQKFREVVESGDEAVCITISSSLSGTYNSARLAAEKYGDKVAVVDSGQTCQALWLLVEEVEELIAQGLSAVEIAKKMETVKKKAFIHFIPATMEYLKRGGRISLLKASMATFLKIKPTLTFNDGKLENTKKSIGMARAVRDLFEGLPQKIKKIFAIHIGDNPFFEKIKQTVAEKFKGISVREGNISPIVGAHIGPGAIGITYILA